MGKIVRAFVACIVCIATLLAIRTAQAQTEEQNVQNILMLLRLDEYERSLQSVNQMLATTPHDCRLQALRGIAFNGLGKPTDALESFKTALRYCPNNPLALESAAQLEYSRQRPDAAGFLERLLKLRPHNLPAHAMLASIDRANNECTKALPHFRASSRLFAQRPRYQQAYAYCLAKTGHNHQAATNYKKILSTDSDPMLRYNLALVQYRLHHASSALATIQPLLATSHQQQVLLLGALLYRARAWRAIQHGNRNTSASALKKAQLLEDKAAHTVGEHAPSQKTTHRLALINENGAPARRNKRRKTLK